MSGSADVHIGFDSVWQASGLNTIFQAYWTTEEKTQYPVLHDAEAAAGQPWPYCVAHVGEGRVISRMTGEGVNRHEVREYTWGLHIFAREFDSNAKSAKQIALELANEVMKIFGGHPTVAPTAITIGTGNFLQAQYQRDFGTRLGDSQHQWTIDYNFTVDVPVAG